MAKPFVDISVLGDKALEKKLAALENKHQAAAVRSAFGKSGTRLKKAIVAAAPVRSDYEGKGHPPGMLKAALKATKLKSFSKFGLIRRFWPLPVRELLGIGPKEKHYWPAAVEYGHRRKGGGRVPPKAYIRGTVNRFQDAEIKRIGQDIGRWIEKKAAKK